ncbi:Uncharacterised protein [Mycobacterium tuberculosis]|uniref:Uncharacterized protein n=1 Tax=Mycobacterium tuberculosis TaxID=1773 RepID=A0A0T7LCJ7_MYCTX|nr:Uncharacterised protein [Mycobacterium tuberculosis]CFB05973.1 Uncharacterised protein [Mycobacterium tuberculosis]CFB94868.1 Uncharacterised protein [Mycobacterium tuberculosis]CFE37867.1 Uncharacterised protein [Mycobacterium tuberculosis]CFQ88894.1 Uncharacterised protein [Mycobacterium tuberculosis]
MRAASHGLLVRPKTGLLAWTSWLPVGMFVLPMMIAPARRNRATASASWVGT